MCRGRRARILLHLHIQREKTVLRGSRKDVGFSLGSYADFGWFLNLKSVSDPFQSQISGFGNELAKSIVFEQHRLE
jgi:hypothetical protein